MGTVATQITESSSTKRRYIIDKVNKWLRHLPAYLVLGGWSLFTIFVFLWIALTALKTNRELFMNVWSLPTDLQFSNFIKAWTEVKLGRYFLNSLLVVGSSVLLILVLSTPASYILSRAKFRGSNLLTLFFVAGIGIPVPLLFIPLFIILAKISLINTLAGLGLIYIAVSLPFTVYMLTGFFGSLPQELEDAAVIDGCSDIQVFSKVMLPLASPGLITATIFNFIFLWNEYQLALVFLSDPKSRTLSLGLYTLTDALQYTGDWVGLFAAVIIVVVSTVILYVFLSEKMIAGITMGAVKS
jgi:ABC-type glycerol-3-phosphate transport system permease component